MDAIKKQIRTLCKAKKFDEAFKVVENSGNGPYYYEYYTQQKFKNM